MDKQKAASDIIAAVLPIVPFEGWTMAALGEAAQKSGYRKTDVIRVFPGGAIDAVDMLSRLGDKRMLEALRQHPLETMKIRERIATAVRTRLDIHAPYREALRKAVAMHAMPFYAARGLRCLYDTVDAIWHACGDTATDFNFYTKRLTLAGVYGSTLICWLDDKSLHHAETWGFLNRRIEDVMKIEKIKGKLFRAGT